MIYFWIAIGIMALSVLYAVIAGNGKYRPQRWFTPFRSICLGVFLSAAFIYAPAFCIPDGSAADIVRQILLSIQYAIRIFLVDSDFELILETANWSLYCVRAAYLIFWCILTVFAPLLTFTFILSFFKSVFAYIGLAFSFNKRLVIFSELNEKSLALANNFYDEYMKNKKSVAKPRFVFCDVFKNNEESTYELLEHVKELKAICFKKDVLSVNFKFHLSKNEISFYVMGDNESENINQSLGIIKNFNNIDNSHLYILASTVGSELVLSSAEKKKIKVRRINEVRSLIYHILTNMVEKGSRTNIFKNVITLSDNTKQIGAVVIGLGNHGTEMLKALSWFCQMTDHKVKITAFDKEALAEARFMALCPELMDKSINGKNIDGEANYDIAINSGIDIETQEFVNLIKALKDTTYVFVSLGNDEMNIKTAAALRTVFEGMKIKPIIEAVVYNTDKNAALKTVTNYKGQEYDIQFVGDLNTVYSPGVIINSQVEEAALEAHLDYFKTTKQFKSINDEKEKNIALKKSKDEFYIYEYNYNSTLAKVIHNRVKQYFNLTEDTTEYQKIEHIRWNAYMRTEGYAFCEERNDLAKLHPDLVPNNKLSKSEKEKDV